MAFPKFEKDISYISKLSDEPNDVDGLSGSELKATFDKAGTDIQAYINNVLLPYLESAEAARSIGIDPIEGLDGATELQAALVMLKDALGDISLGEIPDKSLLNEKFADASVNGRVLAPESVATANLLNRVVTGIKVAQKTLTEENHADESVSSRVLAKEAVQEANVGPEAITNPKIGPEAITGDKVAPKTLTPDLFSDDAKSRAVAVVLTAAGWADNAQTVAVGGVTADNNVLVAAAPTSRSAWNDAEIYCSAQAEGTLTFSCGTAPGADVTANVVILV